MKAFLLIAAFAAITFSSCGDSSAQKSQQEASPKPLQETSTDVGSIKVGRQDLVESLYTDIVDKTPPLKQLENELHDLGVNKNDSTKGFDNFNDMNNSYYTDANSYLTSIKDSVLKGKITEMIAQSQTAYTAKTAAMTNLEDLIATKTEALNDLHIVLKLTKTMAVMENYQNTNMPSAKPMQHILDGYNAAIKKTAALTKK